MHIYAYICVHACTLICMYIYIYICSCVYVCIKFVSIKFVKYERCMSGRTSWRNRLTSERFAFLAVLLSSAIKSLLAASRSLMRLLAHSAAIFSASADIVSVQI